MHTCFSFYTPYTHPRFYSAYINSPRLFRARVLFSFDMALNKGALRPFWAFLTGDEYLISLEMSDNFECLKIFLSGIVSVLKAK